MLKIFAAPGSIALASVIMLEEVEADYELTILDFSRNEQKEASLSVCEPQGSGAGSHHGVRCAYRNPRDSSLHRKAFWL